MGEVGEGTVIHFVVQDGWGAVGRTIIHFGVRGVGESWKDDHSSRCGGGGWEEGHSPFLGYRGGGGGALGRTVIYIGAWGWEEITHLGV